jgi:hypothetical protein
MVSPRRTDAANDADRAVITVEIVAAVVTVIVTVLPAHGVIRRNRFVGVRTRETMRDDDSWARGHRAAIRPTIAAAVVTGLVGGVCLSLGEPNSVAGIIVGATVLVAGALWSVVAAHRALGRP